MVRKQIMDRREFLTASAASLASLALFGIPEPASAKSKAAGPRKYSMVILGDTHFDTEPASVYHALYSEPKEWRYKAHLEEFARNGEMWRDRCPRLLKRCASLIDDSTVMALQVGDLIQGDCDNVDIHRRMLSDAIAAIKKEIGPLPFVTVAGNHDIRGVDAEKTYHEYMPMRMSQELGKSVTDTTFYFMVGKDAFLVIDFNTPDDELIDRMLKETEGARHTFLLTHGPVFPIDTKSARWFFHGGKSKKNVEARLHFRAEFAKREVIVLCGHSHSTGLTEWKGDGGIITQMEMSSVWSKPERGTYEVVTEDPAHYGLERAKKFKTKADGSPLEDVSELFDEYRPGLTRYNQSFTAGSFKLNVGPKHVTIDFHAGDSAEIARTFKLR